MTALVDTWDRESCYFIVLFILEELKMMFVYLFPFYRVYLWIVLGDHVLDARIILKVIVAAILPPIVHVTDPVSSCLDPPLGVSSFSMGPGTREPGCVWRIHVN